MHAITEAYRNVIPPTSFPVVLLFLEMPAEEVDVNVHPAKTEVRFRQQCRDSRLCARQPADGPDQGAAGGGVFGRAGLGAFREPIADAACDVAVAGSPAGADPAPHLGADARADAELLQTLRRSGCTPAPGCRPFAGTSCRFRAGAFRAGASGQPARHGARRRQRCLQPPAASRGYRHCSPNHGNRRLIRRAALARPRSKPSRRQAT